MDNQGTGPTQGTESGSPPQAAPPSGQQPGAAPAAPDREAPSQQTDAERSRGISRFFNRFLREGQEMTADAYARASTERAAEDRRDGPAEGAQPASQKAERRQTPPAAPKSVLDGDPNESVTMTREQLRRTVQSVKDSEIAADNRRNAEMARIRATSAVYENLRALADADTGDPDKLMEAVNAFLADRDTQQHQAAQRAEIDGHVREVGSRYDAEVFRPLLDMLPPEEADRIEREAPEDLIGVAHRAHLFRAALDALKERWTREGEEKARGHLRNSESFRRSVYHDQVDRRQEPDIVQAAAPSNGHQSSSDWLRSVLRS